uniref:Uncharacterized protein n=1 Tax=Brassica campestris TaxID=3711 RepID=A0A3P6DRA9_BRACM|nr:unnamed protein product [Brassica rapa]
MSGLKLRNANVPVPELDDLSEQLPSETRPEMLTRQTSMSQRAMSSPLTSAANLSNLLPTGTLLAFQLLTPVFTSNGVCDHATRLLTAALLFLLAGPVYGISGSFTDSVKAEDGTIYYGFVTDKGMWVVDYPDPSGLGLPDLSKYRMRFVDWIHATLSVWCLERLR